MSRNTVVVVEDETLVRLDTVDMLEEAGMVVVDFDDADHAFQFVKTHLSEVAAIFTDVNLAGQMTGFDLATLVSDSWPDIAITVTSGAFLQTPMKLPDHVQFLSKPWLPLDVLTSMQNAVRN